MGVCRRWLGRRPGAFVVGVAFVEVITAGFLGGVGFVGLGFGSVVVAVVVVGAVAVLFAFAFVRALVGTVAGSRTCAFEDVVCLAVGRAAFARSLACVRFAGV